MKKMWLINILIYCMLIGGCSKENKKESKYYLRLNDTSFGMMSEIETGFLTGINGFLYYADRDNMDTWVPVCNNPNCFHKDSTCNAYIPSSSPYITQKDNHIYGILWGGVHEGMYIYEIKMDGSGIEKVYELPEDDGYMLNGFMDATFSEQIVVYYSYLDEYGMNQQDIIALREDKSGKFITQTLYEENSETKNGNLIHGNGYWSIRGDDVILTTLQAEDGDSLFETLWRVGESELEKINLNLSGDSMSSGYLSNDSFVYYEKNEGFYKKNIYTGEQELIFGNQLKDARGRVFSEEYMIEYVGYNVEKSEEATLKFYNGERWIDIKLPESVKNSPKRIFPVGIGTDRMFCYQALEKTYLSEDGETIKTKEVVDWYYFMLNEKNPELIYIGEIPKSELEYIDNTVEEESEKESIEETESSSESENDTFEEVVIFDTEQYFLKITDIYIDDSDRYCIDIYYENRDNVDFAMANYASINGVQCNPRGGVKVASGKSATSTVRFDLSELEIYKISDLYTASEYTDIEIGFYLMKGRTLEVVDETIYHIYPQGKENIVLFNRESQDTDMMLVDNEYVTVVVTGYEKSLVEGDTVNVFIKNKTEEYINVFVEGAFANGIYKEDIYDGLYNLIVSPGKCSLCPMTLFDGAVLVEIDPSAEFFTSNNITSIEEIKMNLRIYPTNNQLEVIGEDYFNEWITLDV